MTTLPKEWNGPPAFSTVTGKESDTDGLKKVRVNVQRSISSSVQDRLAECDVRVSRLLNSDNKNLPFYAYKKSTEKSWGQLFCKFHGQGGAIFSNWQL